LKKEKEFLQKKLEDCQREVQDIQRSVKKTFNEEDSKRHELETAFENLKDSLAQKEVFLLKLN
jgi:hypothetical protein